MNDFFKDSHPILQALIAGTITWGMTSIGAAMVFMGKEISKKTFDVMLGFAGGVLLAASFWSMLLPAVQLSQSSGLSPFIPITIGFILGVITFWSIDKILPHLHPNFPLEKAEGIKTNWRSSILLVLAITLSAIPEGLAIGVTFGAAALGSPSATLAGAIALAIGIGIQGFPEGFAVSIPLRREGLSRGRSFWYGLLSGLPEPVTAVVAATVVILAQSILPYAMAFSAGAMMFVVIEGVIPECQYCGNTDLATVGIMTGFLLMTVLNLVIK
jgi:zinc transporter, ZIP family